MSGGTGSRRYMSPEVALNENYSLSADLYSFAILFWEVLTLRKAFAYLPVDEHRERVIKNDERLELDPSWSPGIRDILEGCWARNPFQRPAARDVYKAIRAEIQAIYVDEFCPSDDNKS
jgi:serine/threonine protein kinase